MSKFISFIPLIALFMQGLFPPLNASDYPMPASAYTNGGFMLNTYSDEKTLREQAMRCAERGLVDLAISAFNRITVLCPDDAEAHAYLGWAYSQKGMFPEAVESFQKVLHINPGLKRTSFDYPMAKAIPGAIKAFTSRLEGLISQADDLPLAHEVLGSCYVLQGRLGDALNAYQKALNLRHGRNKRDSVSEIHAIDHAINEYREAIATRPDCADAYIRLACAHAEKGMLDIAIEDMKRAMSVKPDLIETHIYMGCFYVKKGMMDDALKELIEAEKTRDFIIEKLLLEGERCINDGAFDKTIALALSALKVEPGNKKAMRMLAMAHAKNGGIKNATEICRETIGLYPEDPFPYILLGWIYAQCDRFGDSMDLAEQAFQLDGNNTDIMALMAFVYASRGQTGHAAEMCSMIVSKTSTAGDYGWVTGNVPSIEQKFREVRDVLEIKPDYADGYLCLGWLHSKNGENERAITAFRRAVELMPDLYNAHLYLGNTYVQKGEIKYALDKYNKALNMLCERARAALTQGEAYLKEGNAEQAVACFNNALRLNPQCGEAYFLLAGAYEKKGLYSAAMVLRLQGEGITAHKDLVPEVIRD